MSIEATKKHREKCPNAHKHDSTTTPCLSTGHLVVLTVFYVLHKCLLFTLYNIPYCKMKKDVLYYRHKEETPL